MKKINIAIRFKNPAFIVSLLIAVLSPILMYTGLNLEDLTTWRALLDVLVGAISNPYCLALVVVSVYNTILDPTTKGIGDSDRVINKTKL